MTRPLHSGQNIRFYEHCASISKNQNFNETLGYLSIRILKEYCICSCLENIKCRRIQWFLLMCKSWKWSFVETVEKCFYFILAWEWWMVMNGWNDISFWLHSSATSSGATFYLEWPSKTCFITHCNKNHNLCLHLVFKPWIKCRWRPKEGTMNLPIYC